MVTLKDAFFPFSVLQVSIWSTTVEAIFNYESQLMFSFQLQQVYKQLNVRFFFISSVVLHTEGVEIQNSLKQIDTGSVYLVKLSSLALDSIARTLVLVCLEI